MHLKNQILKEDCRWEGKNGEKKKKKRREDEDGKQYQEGKGEGLQKRRYRKKPVR